MTGYQKWHSPRLGEDFELKVYGHAGKPLLAFPSMGGRFFDFEDFGMIEACRPLLEAGRLRIFAVDGRDWQSWKNAAAPASERGRRHAAWESCLLHEVIPFIGSVTGSRAPRRTMVAGASGGAFHAANFFFRHPDLVDTVIAMSGVYSLEQFLPLGGYCDDNIYYNDPLRYLPALADDWFLNLYRKSRIVISAGQGAWEHMCLPESERLSNVLCAKAVPHWFDVWGPEANHDWVWWRKQLPYFLEHVLCGGPGL